MHIRGNSGSRDASEPVLGRRDRITPAPGAGGARRRAGWRAAVFAAPESVFWLTGLDHWGYFAPHLLIVPLDGAPALVTRAMERVTIERQVTAAEFVGHSDSETAADRAAQVIAARRLAGRRLGLEMWTAGLSHGLAVRLLDGVAAEWCDVSGLVDALRRVKSAEEQALMRRAAGSAGRARRRRSRRSPTACARRRWRRHAAPR